FAALIRPAAFLSASTFQTTWFAILLLAFWLYAWGLARIAFKQCGWHHVLGTGVVLVATPGMGYTMSFGNVDVVVWALTAWGLKSDTCLLLGTALKLYPVSGLAVTAVRRRTILSVTVMSLSAFVLAFAVLGPAPFLE